MKFKITGILAALMLSLSFMGCEQPANTNTANTNANTNANATANANANANTNANTNASRDTSRAPTREEYDRDKGRYEREARESGRKIGTGTGLYPTFRDSGERITC